MFDNVRRVVTVLGDDGLSRFESDGGPTITRRLPNARTAIDEIWRFPAVPADVTAPGDAEEFSFLSPDQGFVVRRAEVPPDREKFVDEHGNPRTPEPHEGMHQTATIDIIQMLEGGEREVRTLYDKIRHDKRHHTVLTLGEGEIETRMFSEWAMGFKNVDDASFAGLPGHARIGEASFDPTAFRHSNVEALKRLKFFHDAT